MNWFMEFANGLAEVSWWPLIAFTIIVGFIGILSWIQRDDPGSDIEYMSGEYGDATWRMFASAQAIGIAWLLYILVAAVPAPDYMTKTRVIERVKEVTILPEFKDAYDQCMRRLSPAPDEFDATQTRCERFALTLVRPDIKQITYNTTRVRTRTIRVVPSYQGLFDQCMQEWSPDDDSEKATAIRTCHNHATWTMNGGTTYWNNP